MTHLKRIPDAELSACEALLLSQFQAFDRAFCESENGSRGEERALEHRGKTRHWLSVVRLERGRRERLVSRKPAVRA